MDNENQIRIVKNLEYIVAELGNVYMGMADNYPRILDLMDEKFRSLDTSDMQKKNAFCGLDDMEESVAYLQNIVSSEGIIFTKLSEKDSGFLDNLEVELKKSSLFEEHIKVIEDDSAELELISLNAMVTALKAGKNGGAFPYITEELQAVSKDSAYLSNRLKDHGENMDRVFRSFLSNIDSDKSDLNQAMDIIAENLNNMLKLIKEYKDKIHILVSELQKGVGGIRDPLYHIIQEVQKHDIVRQSIDHVILSFQKGLEVSSVSTEDELDYLTYQYQVYSFCKDILSEIGEGIDETYKLFQEKSDDLSEMMLTIQKSGETFLNQSGNDSYSLKIREFQKSISQNSEIFRKGFSRESLKKNLSHLLKEIGKLEESSNGFVRIINWVKTINISSRVEAAKLPHLENMNFIIENINNRTDSIEQNVEVLTRIIGDFRKSTDRLFNDYFKDFTDDAAQLEQFIVDLRKGLEGVSDSHEKVDYCTLEIVKAGQAFDEFYQMTRKDLRTMKDLMKKLYDVTGIVDTQKNQYKEKLDHALAASPYSEWKLRGNEIKDLIDKFTIFIHKKKADITSSFALEEEGASSGEVTLF